MARSFLSRPLDTISAAALVSGAWLAMPASAQERPDTVRADSAFVVEGFVIMGDRTATSTGGSSSIELRPDSLVLPIGATIEDALRSIPFVLIRQNSRGNAEISVRGSESRQVAVLLDGVPLTLAWDHRTDPAVIPLDGVQEITFVRGLPSVLSGPNVLGGVVEINVGRAATLAPEERDMRARIGFDDAGYFAVGATGSAIVYPGSGRDVLAVRGGVGRRTRDGVALPGGVSDPTARDGLRTNSDVDEWTGFTSLRWEGGEGGWISLSTSGYKAVRGVPPELHIEEPRLWRYPDEWQAVAALTLGTGQRQTPWGEGDVEVSAGLNMGEQDVDAFSGLDYSDVVETEVGRGRTATLRILADHTLSSDGELRAAATYADVNHTEILNGTERNEYRQRLWSFGSEVAWRLPRTTRISVGGAIDGADTPETGGKPALGALTAWGGRLGISSLALSPDLQLHASVSSRARFPALRELYSGSLGRFEPNPGLKSERLVALEGGATLHRSSLELQAVVFHHRLDDAVVRTATAEGLFRRVNRDRITSTGLEFLLGTMVERAQVLASVMIQDVSVEDRTGGTGPMRPEHTPEFRAAFELDAPLPFEIHGLATVERIGSQSCVHPDFGVDVNLDASSRIDVGVRRSFRAGSGFWQRIRATLSLDNVTDGSIYDQCGMPQPGRTLRVGIEVL